MFKNTKKMDNGRNSGHYFHFRDICNKFLRFELNFEELESNERL